MYLDLCAVGGDEGVGEDGGGFGKEGFGLFVAGTDVGEEELLGAGLEGQGGGLRGGAVEFFGGDGGEGVVEGAFETEEVDVLDIGEDALGVGGVGAVGVTTCGVGTTGFLFDEVAVGGYGVNQREGEDAAEVVFEKGEGTFGVGELVVADVEVDMASRDRHDGLHGMGDAGGGIDVEGLFTSAEVHAADEAGEAEEMVAMEVGDADEGAGEQSLVVDAYLCLGVLAAVEKDAEAVDVDHLSATVAGSGGQGGS